MLVAWPEEHFQRFADRYLIRAAKAVSIQYAAFDLYDPSKRKLQGDNSEVWGNIGRPCGLWTERLAHRWYTPVLANDSPHRGDQSVVFAARTLANLSKCPGNRTLLYKVELDRAAVSAARPPTPAKSLRFKGTGASRRVKDKNTASESLANAWI